MASGSEAPWGDAAETPLLGLSQTPYIQVLSSAPEVSERWVRRDAFERALGAAAMAREDELLVALSSWTCGCLPRTPDDRLEELPARFCGGESTTFKARVREGLPCWLRGAAWVWLCGAGALCADRGDVYEVAHGRVFPGGDTEALVTWGTLSADPEAVPVGLHLTASGEDAHHRVMSVFAAENPDVVYCPAATKAAGVMLHFMAPAEVYACLHAMTERSRADRFYFNLGRGDVQAFVETFAQMVVTMGGRLHRAKGLKAVRRHASALSVDIHAFASHWFSQLFVGVLPLATALHVIDAWVSEGTKVLYRVGLALLCLHSEVLCATESAEAFLKVLGDAAAGTTDSSALMNMAFRIRRFKRSTIATVNATVKAKGMSGINASFYTPVAMYYRPEWDTPSSVVGYEQFAAVWTAIPTRLRTSVARRVFSTESDGRTVDAMRRACTQSPCLVWILVEPEAAASAEAEAEVEVEDGESPATAVPATAVLGVFLSRGVDSSVPLGDIMGSGESFVFRVTPDPAVWRWRRGCNVVFYRFLSSRDGGGFVVGDGATGAAVSLNEDMTAVRTGPCETFALDPGLLTGVWSTDDVVTASGVCVEVFAIE